MFLLFSQFFVTSQNLFMDMSSLQIIRLHYISLLYQRHRGQDFVRLQNAAQKGTPSNCVSLPDLEFVKKFTRPNFQAKEFYTLKTRKSRLFLPAINNKNASLSVI